MLKLCVFTHKLDWLVCIFELPRRFAKLQHKKNTCRWICDKTHGPPSWEKLPQVRATFAAFTCAQQPFNLAYFSHAVQPHSLLKRDPNMIKYGQTVNVIALHEVSTWEQNPSVESEEQAT